MTLVEVHKWKLLDCFCHFASSNELRWKEEAIETLPDEDKATILGNSSGGQRQVFDSFSGGV